MSDLRSSPRVSVVIPTRDRPLLLKRAITSILNQTFADVEIVVVDDGSSGDTALNLGDFASLVRLFRHDRPKGPGAARNTGIRMAQGEYLAFLDDDDEWFPEKLERQVRVLDSASERVGVVYTGVVTRYRDGKIEIERAVAHGNVYEKVLGHARGLPINNISLMVRKRCFDDMGDFDESLPYGEGWDLFMRLARRWEFAAIPEPLAIIYLRHRDDEPELRRVISGLSLLLEKHREEIQARPRCAGWIYYGRGVFELKLGDAAAARDDFLRAIAVWPFNPKAAAYLALAVQPRFLRDVAIASLRMIRRWRSRLSAN